MSRRNCARRGEREERRGGGARERGRDRWGVRGVRGGERDAEERRRERGRERGIDREGRGGGERDGGERGGGEKEKRGGGEREAGRERDLKRVQSGQ